MNKCIETSWVVAIYVIFIYQLKGQIKIYLSVVVEFTEKITYPREYVSIHVSFPERSRIQTFVLSENYLRSLNPVKTKLRNGKIGRKLGGRELSTQSLGSSQH